MNYKNKFLIIETVGIETWNLLLATTMPDVSLHLILISIVKRIILISDLLVAYTEQTKIASLTFVHPKVVCIKYCLAIEFLLAVQFS